MLKFNLIKMATKPTAGKVAEPVEGNVNLPEGEGGGEQKSAPGKGGEED